MVSQSRLERNVPRNDSGQNCFGFILLLKNYFATGFMCVVIDYVRRLKIRFIKKFPKIETEHLAVTQQFSPQSEVHSFVSCSFNICLNITIGHNCGIPKTLCETPKTVSETDCNAISKQNVPFLYYISNIKISISLTLVNTLVKIVTSLGFEIKYLGHRGNYIQFTYINCALPESVSVL